jgi:hypothetical protein
MRLTKSKSYIVLLGLGLAILVVILVFNVKFVNKTVITSQGLRFENEQQADGIRRQLEAQGIPYKIQFHEQGVDIWWDKKHVQTNQDIRYAADGLLEGNSRGLCFPESSGSAFNSLVQGLVGANIPHTTINNSGESCVNWRPEDDLAVQEVYPNLKNIRELQSKRAAE